MIVDSLMHRDVATLPASATVRAAALLMRSRGVGCVIATVADSPAGMLTERDVTFRIVAEGRDAEKTLVAEVMTRPLATIEPSASIEEAAERMKSLRVKRLVVVLGDQVRGIVTVTDIAYAEPMLNKSLIEGWVKTRWQG
ncbi:MAG: CBS domain-containing protein [Candidatus Thermoplasmatota archaeon]